MAMSVQRTADLERVLKLPVREPDDTDYAELFTEVLKTPEGTEKLWPIQGRALKEIYECEGGFCPIPVGNGKTLISLLAPVVCEPYAKRPLLIVPAGLRDDTIFNRIPEIRKHWTLRRDLRIIATTDLSNANKVDILDDIYPDFIVIDEAHLFRNLSRGRGRRLFRYLNENPEVRLVVMSGTLTNRSLMDYWHMLVRSLGENAPVPLKPSEAASWASVIDERVPAAQRGSAGALKLLMQPQDLGDARKAYQRRLHATPGVIVGDPKEVGSSLIVRKMFPKVTPGSQEIIEYIESNFSTPMGYEFTEAMHVADACKQALQGFYYYWDPLPPAEWMRARKAWAKYVRDRIKLDAKRIDTELQVARECAELAAPPKEYLDWIEIEPTFTPNTVAHWFDETALEPAIEWLEKKRGICWVLHNEVGTKLESLTGFRYFGPGKEAAMDIEKHRAPMIASIRAHSTGRNLQGYHYKNLVICPPGTGQIWEQLLGRTHRPGQKSDNVEFWVWQHHFRLVDAFERALVDAEVIEQTTGPRQKLSSLARITNK